MDEFSLPGVPEDFTSGDRLNPIWSARRIDTRRDFQKCRASANPNHASPTSCTSATGNSKKSCAESNHVSSSCTSTRRDSRKRCAGPNDAFAIEEQKLDSQVVADSRNDLRRAFGMQKQSTLVLEDTVEEIQQTSKQPSGHGREARTVLPRIATPQRGNTASLVESNSPGYSKDSQPSCSRPVPQRVNTVSSAESNNSSCYSKDSQSSSRSRVDAVRFAVSTNKNFQKQHQTKGSRLDSLIADVKVRQQSNCDDRTAKQLRRERGFNVQDA